ncbi:hypothetical protein F5878DRAFT_620266 [Lentinula raphanica]|uniref:Uncharacterized protein n=1 Tax=Lentinula raphanica TaxID=153919 RepID=A0AA38P894_9AGAR|nr:hypothetical protein F5878DRAFT_620266 [Lentinula raphanica]
MVSIGPNQLQGQTIHRQPLADLPLTKFAAKPSFNTDPFRPVDIPKHRPCPETPVIVPQTPMTDIDDSIARFRPGYIQPPPRQLVERSPTASIADGSSLYQPSSPYSSTAFASRAPGIPMPRTIEAKSRFKPVGHKAIARAVPATARGSFRLQNATNPNLTPARLPTTPAMALAATVPVSRSFATATNIDSVDPTPTDSSLVTTLAPSTLRQRRSPFREGRRFIPLDDSDTSDDEQRKT